MTDKLTSKELADKLDAGHTDEPCAPAPSRSVPYVTFAWLSEGGATWP